MSKSHFLSTSSHQVMNLVLAIEVQREAKNTEEYLVFTKKQSDLRFKQIFKEPPYQAMFS
jgi:hypothetical protein